MRSFAQDYLQTNPSNSMHRKKQTRSQQKQGEYEVDKILDKRIRDGMIAYKIQWRGFPASDATWEPIENLQKCQDMITEFEKNRKEANKSAKAQSTPKQPQPIKPVEKKKQKPIIEPKKTEQHRKPESKPEPKPAPKPNQAVSFKQTPLPPKTIKQTPLPPKTFKQTPLPPKNSRQTPPLAQSRVNTLFSGFKGDRLRTSRMDDGATTPTETEHIKFPSKGRLAGSHVAQEGKGKKREFAEQANLKRSLASHINNQNQEYEHDKTRKMQKTMHYVDDAPQAEKTTKPHEIAEKLINRFGQKPKDKTVEIRQKPNNIKDRPTYEQQTQLKSTPKQSEPSRNLKLQDETLKRTPQRQADKNLLSVSRMSRQQTQDPTKALTPSCTAKLKSKLTDMFGHMERYRILDEYLILHKQMGILNIINKDQGGRQEKPKIKMLEVGSYDLVEEQLQHVKRINRETAMQKLESLIKFEEGWVAVGKNKHEGLFMMDVNLLHEHVWKVIKDMYKAQ